MLFYQPIISRDNHYIHRSVMMSIPIVLLSQWGRTAGNMSSINTEINTSWDIKQNTRYNVILSIARNLLETRENTKIEFHPFYPIICDWFWWGSSKKKFFLKKKFKMADSNKLSFSTLPKAEQFPPKFHGLVLGLVGLIDAKGINVTQPIWPSGCLM